MGICGALGLLLWGREVTSRHSHRISTSWTSATRLRDARSRPQRRLGALLGPLASIKMCVGIGLVEGARCALAISDFRFIGGTLGTVAGEKIRLIACEALAERLPLVSLVCSGGVRIQDGTLGLVQMAKSNAAVQKLLDAGMPHLSWLSARAGKRCMFGRLPPVAQCECLHPVIGVGASNLDVVPIGRWLRDDGSRRGCGVISNRLSCRKRE